MPRKAALPLAALLLVLAGLCLAAGLAQAEDIEAPHVPMSFNTSTGLHKAVWAREGLTFYVGVSQSDTLAIGFIDERKGAGYYVDLDVDNRTARVNYSRDIRQNRTLSLPKTQLEVRKHPDGTTSLSHEWNNRDIVFVFSLLSREEAGYVIADNTTGCEYIVIVDAEGDRAKARIERPN